MSLNDVVNRAIPIYPKDCPEGKCEKDCRLSIDYKERMREWLKKQIIAYAEAYHARAISHMPVDVDKLVSYVERMKYQKK